MLVGDVTGRTAILIDDLADTSNTVTRAARLLKKEGATSVIALLTHGILSGEAIERINKSDLDKVVVTNSVPQHEHLKRCPKLQVLDVGHIFAEVSLGSRLPRRTALANWSRQFDVCTTEKASAFCSPTIEYQGGWEDSASGTTLTMEGRYILCLILDEWAFRRNPK